MGKQIGDQVLATLGANPGNLSSEVVLTHTAGVIGLFGWGRLGLERWGDAAVAVVDQLPVLDDDHLGVAALLGGVFSVLASHEVACVPVDHGRFVLVDPSIAEQVWLWSRDGQDVPSIVARLTPEGLK